MLITVKGKQILTLGKKGDGLELMNAVTDPWTHMKTLRKAATRMYGPVITGRMAKACGGDPDPTKAKNQSVMAKTYGLLIVGDAAFNVQPDKPADVWVTDNAFNRLTKRVIKLEKNALVNNCRYALDKLELPRAKYYQRADRNVFDRHKAKIDAKRDKLLDAIPDNITYADNPKRQADHEKECADMREKTRKWHAAQMAELHKVYSNAIQNIAARNDRAFEINNTMDKLRRENLVLACCGVTNIAKATPVGLSRLHFVLTGSAT
jgi:hypothetical protein